MACPLPSKAQTLLHARHNGSKVVIQQDHVSSIFSSIRASNAHGYTNVSFLQGWGVIHTIPCYSHNGALRVIGQMSPWLERQPPTASLAHPPPSSAGSHQSLTALHNHQLLLRTGSSKHHLRVGAKRLHQLRWVHVLQLHAIDDTGPGIPTGGRGSHWGLGPYEWRGEPRGGLVDAYFLLTWSTGIRSRAAMSSTVSLPSEMMPTLAAMALAVMGWSPVTMITCGKASTPFTRLDQSGVPIVPGSYLSTQSLFGKHGHLLCLGPKRQLSQSLHS